MRVSQSVSQRGGKPSERRSGVGDWVLAEVPMYRSATPGYWVVSGRCWARLGLARTGLNRIR